MSHESNHQKDSREKLSSPDSPVNKLKTSLGQTPNLVIKDVNTSIVIDETGVKIDDIGIEDENLMNSGHSKTYNAEQLDIMRKHSQSYFFLCKCVEASEWINKFVPCDNVGQMISELPKGVILATIAKECGFSCTVHNVTDSDRGSYFEVENIYTFIRFCDTMGLDKRFMFETNDLRDMKNLRSVVYCLHALAILLKKKGIAEGIKKQMVQLADGEKDLWKDEEGDKIFENLENDVNKTVGLNSSEEENKTQQSEDDLLEKESKEENIKSQKVTAPDVIRSFVDTLNYSYAFKNIFYCYKVNMQCLKKFIHLMPQDDPEMIESDIIEHFRRNLLLKNRIDEVYKNTRLLLTNQAQLRNVTMDKTDLTHNLNDFKKALYLFMTNYDLVGKMIMKNEQFAINTVYPPTVAGDHHFTKVILNLMEKNFDEKSIKKIAQVHFEMSSVHKEIKDHLNTMSLLEINPVEIYKKMYNMSVYDDNAIFEVAMGEDKVKKEVLRNFETFIKAMHRLNSFVLNMELPAYCHLFKNQYETFIKKIVQESNSSKYEAEIGRIIFGEENTFNSNNNNNNSNNSSIGENLLEELCPSFVDNFRRNYKNNYLGDINEIHDLLLQRLESSQGLKIKAPYEAINTVILMMKKNQKELRGEITKIVKDLKMFHKTKTDKDCVDLDLSGLYRDNTQLLENSTVHTILIEVKKKMVALMKHNKKRDVLAMLYLRGGLEYKCHDQVDSVDSADSITICYEESDRSVHTFIKELKRNLQKDLLFLEQEGITSRTNKYNEIFQMIAQDIMKPENRDMELNDETAEMVAQRGESLRNSLSALEKYYVAMTKAMTSNKKETVLSLDKSLIVDTTNAQMLDMATDLRLFLTNIGNTKYRAEVKLNGRVLVTDALYLTDILRDMEDGLNGIELGHTLKIEGNALLKEINRNFVSY